MKGAYFPHELLSLYCLNPRSDKKLSYRDRSRVDQKSEPIKLRQIHIWSASSEWLHGHLEGSVYPWWSLNIPLGWSSFCHVQLRNIAQGISTQFDETASEAGQLWSTLLFALLAWSVYIISTCKWNWLSTAEDDNQFFTGGFSSFQFFGGQSLQHRVGINQEWKILQV